MQISSTSWIGRSSCRFIPTSRIGDLWIREGFYGFEVRFYLAIVVEGEEGLVVVFPVGLFPLTNWEGDMLRGWGMVDVVAEEEGTGVGVEGDETVFV